MCQPDQTVHYCSVRMGVTVTKSWRSLILPSPPPPTPQNRGVIFCLKQLIANDLNFHELHSYSLNENDMYWCIRFEPPLPNSINIVELSPSLLPTPINIVYLSLTPAINIVDLSPFLPSPPHHQSPHHQSFLFQPFLPSPPQQQSDFNSPPSPPHQQSDFNPFSLPTPPTVRFQPFLPSPHHQQSDLNPSSLPHPTNSQISTLPFPTPQQSGFNPSSLPHPTNSQISTLSPSPFHQQSELSPSHTPHRYLYCLIYAHSTLINSLRSPTHPVNADWSPDICTLLSGSVLLEAIKIAIVSR